MLIKKKLDVMTKKAIYILSIIVLTGMSACQSDEPQLNVVDDAKALVTLSAQLDGPAETRTAFEKVNSSLPFPFDVAVWASTTTTYLASDVKDGTDHANVDRHVTAHFSQASTVLPGPDNSGIRYPETTAVPPAYPIVNFIGLYPATDWTTAEGGTQATHLFHGYEDLMYAPQVSGNGNINPASDSYLPDPTLTFHHLLTYLKFKMVTTEEARNAWGKLTSISLTTTNNKVTTALSTATPTFDNGSGTVTFSAATGGDAITSMPLYGLGNDIQFPLLYYTLPTTATEVAYVLCAPVVASSSSGDYEYTLSISTENRAGLDVPINLMYKADPEGDATSFAGSTMGKEFTVTLTFTQNTISVAAEVSSWDLGGSGKQNVEE